MKKPEYNIAAEDQIDWIVNATLDIIGVISFLNIENLSGDEKTDSLNSDEYLRISADILYHLFDAMWTFAKDSEFFLEQEVFEYHVNQDTLLEEIQDLNVVQMFQDRKVYLKNLVLVGEYAVKLNRSSGRFRVSSLIDAKLGDLLLNAKNFDKALSKYQKILPIFQKNCWNVLFCSCLLNICKCYKA
jgi:hypothetical protein